MMVVIQKRTVIFDSCQAPRGQLPSRYLQSGTICSGRVRKANILIIFNEIYRIVMAVLFVAFAYDSANRQLKRENLTK